MIVRLVTGLNWAAAVVAIAAGLSPYLLVRYAAVRRTRLFEDQFPQAIDLIASSLRAGHAFTSGVSMVSDEVADPTGAEFRLLYDQQNFGMPLPDALKAFARRVPLLDARFFITAVLTQREAGGNLAEVLDNLAGLIRERSRVKRQVRVTSAHGRITGWVLSMMPPALFLHDDAGRARAHEHVRERSARRPDDPRGAGAAGDRHAGHSEIVNVEF